MKVAILSESEADEAVIQVLVDGILEQSTEIVPHLSLRSRGWPAVRNLLPGVIHHLHYQIGADVLVVVADSDNSPVHKTDHAGDEDARSKCRFCELRQLALRKTQSLRSVGGRPVLRVAIGLAVPSLEAWLRCGHDPDVCEAKWREGLERKREPYTRNELKHRVYGTDRPNLALLKSRGVEEARRLIQDLGTLEARFRDGFGSFAAQIRSWTAG